MKAAFYRETGRARNVIEIGELPDPEAGPGEVRVRVAFSGINPSDVKARAGRGLRGGFPLVIPHSDGAGTIDQVGPGVPPERLGTRVWTWNAQIKRPFGTAAEYVVLPSEQAVPLPGGVSEQAGACLGVPFMTAWRAVHQRPAVLPGTETILVAGGAGTVGGYAIQLARRAGYRVITTISSVRKAEQVLELGAHHVINYREEDVAERIRVLTGGQGVDRIIEVDLAANAKLYTGALARGGMVIVYGSSDWSARLPLGEFLVHGVELTLFNVYELKERTRAAAILDSATVLADPSFRHRIAATFTIDETIKAHEVVESGQMIGNVLVTPSG
ncbi:NADPH:quinone reductase [Rhizosaccharibacter radicis]|uniref:NADPH:quinone reductase n=1 Tax=Rhizosaccharibacter radicis TaxID=2782605 RepID=A0ABT1VZ80_9PROT|nr:NADPH:quinone reductase [Acetobacteraceae bacterium KSS12]